jgi:hypothetical protein
MSFIIMSSTDYYGPTTEYGILEETNRDGDRLPTRRFETREEAQDYLDTLEDERDYSKERLDHNQSSHTEYMVAEVLVDNVDEPSAWQIVDRYLSFTDEYPEDWDGWSQQGEAAQAALDSILAGEAKALIWDDHSRQTLLVQYE